MFAVLTLIPSEGSGGLFCVYDCVCTGVRVGKSYSAVERAVVPRLPLTSH